MAQRRCKSPESRPIWARACLTGFVSVVFFCVVSTGSVAQLGQFGRSSGDVRGPNVFVDLGVLNSLGPAPNVPRVLQPTLRQPQMPGARALESRFPNRRVSKSATGRIVLKPPSSLRPRKSKRRASKKRAPRLTRPSVAAPKTRTAARTPKVAPRMTRPGPRPPAAPKIQSVSRPAALKPPRALAKATPKLAPKPVAKVAKRAVPKAPVKTRKPPMPKVLARPTPPLPRSSITPPPMPRKIVKATPPAPPPMRKIAKPIRKAAPNKAAPKKPSQTASLPPVSRKPATANLVRLAFKGGEAKLPAPAIKQLDDVVGKLTKQSTLRLQLLAYADGTTSSGSQARRLSLSRALAVRSYLIEKGIRSTRIDVRALGNQVKGSPADRVDIVINKR